MEGSCASRLSWGSPFKLLTYKSQFMRYFVNTSTIKICFKTSRGELTQAPADLRVQIYKYAQTILVLIFMLSIVLLDSPSGFTLTLLNKSYISTSIVRQNVVGTYFDNAFHRSHNYKTMGAIHRLVGR